MWFVKIADIRKLSFEELRMMYREYMISKGLSANTINTASMESFYIWKKGSEELFWDTLLSSNFEEEGKRIIQDLLKKHSKADPIKYTSNYVSHLRRFREFVSTLQDGEDFRDIISKQEMLSKRSTLRSTKEQKTVCYEETIIVERMYAGGYLGDNIGHEIINTFKTDAGDNYIYISPWGIINPKYQNVKAVLLVRLINEHCYEVIGYASELLLLLSQEAMMNTKHAGEIENERQRAIIEEHNITYGGLSVNEIFSEQDNTVFVTFKAGKYRNVKKQKKIYIVDNEDYVLNESYIFIPEFHFSNQSLKLYAPKEERARAFTKLDSIIKDEQYWEEENTSSVVGENTGEDSAFGILDVIGKGDDELVYSNWMGYYLKNNVRLAERFAHSILGIEIMAKHMDVKREYHNIDLWLEDDNNIVVIENKIKSGINGVDIERHDLKSDMIQSQLSKYYSIAEAEAKKKDKKAHYYIFLPDYSYKDEDLSVYLMADKYTVIRYSKLSHFFEAEDENYLYIEEFKKALRKHATPYYKDLYQIMEERFIKKIHEKRQKL